MSEWKEYKIKDIAEILDFKRKPLSSMERVKRKGQYPYYGASGIIDYLDDYIFEGEHVLISEDGENLRSRQTPIAFLADGQFWVNNHAHIIKSDYVHNRLICYYFANLDINPFITGAVQPKLSQDSLCRIPICLPESIEERKEIVSILSSLEYKIDLLNRENATLEAMAETLFRQWFIEEAKEDWEEGKLEDEFAFTMGQSPSGDSFNEEGVGIPMYQGNADFGFRFPTRRVYTTQPTRFAEVNDTLISVRAPVGAQNMAMEKCCIGRGVAAFRYKNNPSYFSYTYYKLKSLLEEIKQFNDNGTVFGSISKSDFENLETTIPDENTIMSFQQQVKVIDDKIVNNNNEIQTLIQTRDGLLPKLMNDEMKM